MPLLLETAAVFDVPYISNRRPRKIASLSVYYSLCEELWYVFRKTPCSNDGMFVRWSILTRANEGKGHPRVTELEVKRGEAKSLNESLR